MQERKRVLVSTHDPLHPISGGGALRTLNAAKEFARRGHEVRIIAPTDGAAEVDGLKVEWLHPPRKQRSQILSSIKFNVRLLRKFLPVAGRTDLFFVHNTIAAAVLPFLKPFFRFRFVLDITDVHAEYLPVGRRTLVERLACPVLLWIEYWIIDAADFVIVVTEAMRRLLIEKGISADKIAVVSDGAQPDEIPSDKEAGSGGCVIHLGTIDRQHGVELLVRAVPLVLRRKPATRFLFVGGGRELPNVRTLAAELKVEDSCVFTDYLPCEQARQWLRKAEVGVIPRLDSVPNRIVTTLKIYEYWASRTAVVASRLEGIAEIAQDGRDVAFFPSGDAQRLADGIVALLEDEPRRKRLQQGGFETVQRYLWDRLTPRIVDLALGAGGR